MSEMGGGGRAESGITGFGLEWDLLLDKSMLSALGSHTLSLSQGEYVVCIP